MAAEEGEVWTIGHSTHPRPDGLAIVPAPGSAAGADVRRFPGSRRHPQFGAEPLGAALEAQGNA